MGKARIINAIFWLWLWLSDVFSPVATDADFWTEKATQLFRFNESINMGWTGSFSYGFKLPTPGVTELISGESPANYFAVGEFDSF